MMLLCGHYFHDHIDAIAHIPRTTHPQTHSVLLLVVFFLEWNAQCAPKKGGIIIVTYIVAILLLRRTAVITAC